MKLKYILLGVSIVGMIFLLSSCTGVPAPTKPQIVFTPEQPFAGQDVTINVDSSDEYSSLSYALSVDGKTLSPSSMSTYHWKATLGVHTFVATVSDTYGHSVSSIATLDIKSPPLPCVEKLVWYPSSPIGGDNVEFFLNATSVVGIRDVEMNMDGNALRIFKRGDSYVATWLAVPGTHAVGVTLKDVENQISATKVTLNVGPYPFPKILSFTWTPQDPSLKDRYVVFKVVGRDPSGFYASVKVDGQDIPTTLLSSDTAVATWTVKAGYHTVQAKLIDAKGWYVERTVYIPIQPLQSDLKVQIGITPSHPSHGDKVIVKAYARDSYAPIANMTLFIDGVEEAQVATNTLAYTFFPSDGNHEITVNAVDKLNAKASSNLFFTVKFDPNMYPPKVRTFFTPDATVGTPKLLTVYATPTAPDARIVKVSFEDLVGSQELGVSTSCSNGMFSIAWVPKEAGYIPIMVTACDSYMTQSSTVVMVKVSPRAVNDGSPMIEPDFSSLIKESSKVSLCASITSRYSLQSVKSWIDGVPLTPFKKRKGFYCVEWIAQATGTHTFEVSAEDIYGHQASETFYFYVYPGRLPVTRIELNSSRFYTGQELMATADVVKTAGAVERVEFYIDGNLVQSSYTPPYVLKRKVNNAGVHVLMVKTVDVYGNIGYAQANYRVLKDTTPPVLAIDAPSTAASGQVVKVKITTFDEQTRVKELKVDLYSSRAPKPYVDIIPIISKTYFYPATDTIFTFKAASSTVYRVYVTSEDVAGNRTSLRKIVSVK